MQMEIYVAGIGRNWPESILCARSAAQIAFTASRISLSAGSFPVLLLAPIEHASASLRSLFGTSKRPGLGIDAAAGDLAADGVPLVFQDRPSAAFRRPGVVRLASRRHLRPFVSDRVALIEIDTPHEAVPGHVGLHPNALLGVYWSFHGPLLPIRWVERCHRLLAVGRNLHHADPSRPLRRSRLRQARARSRDSAVDIIRPTRPSAAPTRAEKSAAFFWACSRSPPRQRDDVVGGRRLRPQQPLAREHVTGHVEDMRRVMRLDLAAGRIVQLRHD